MTDESVPRTITAKGHRVTQPVIVHSRADIASLLQAHRESLGWTCEEFDARAGFSDRYVTKMERAREGKPTIGRLGFQIHPPTEAQDHVSIKASFMADVWLETAGLALVLMPVELARSIGAVQAPKRSEGVS